LTEQSAKKRASKEETAKNEDDRRVTA